MPHTDIILLERIKNLGNMGELVKVKPGYARNYLLPQGKALRATKDNRARYEAEREAREATNKARRGDAEATVKAMHNLSVVLIRAASESGQLYGSATSRDIAMAISEAGFATDRSQVEMDRALKTLGLFPIRIAIHPEVTATVTVNIARSADEAAKQLQLGRAIVADDREAEARAVAKGRIKPDAKSGDRQRDKPPSASTPQAKPIAEGDTLTTKPAKASDDTGEKPGGKPVAKPKAKEGGEEKAAKSAEAKPGKSLLGRLLGG